MPLISNIIVPSVGYIFDVLYCPRLSYHTATLNIGVNDYQVTLHFDQFDMIVFSSVTKTIINFFSVSWAFFFVSGGILLLLLFYYVK